jgi:hypothetical protein
MAQAQAEGASSVIQQQQFDKQMAEQAREFNAQLAAAGSGDLGLGGALGSNAVTGAGAQQNYSMLSGAQIPGTQSFNYNGQTKTREEMASVLSGAAPGTEDWKTVHDWMLQNFPDSSSSDIGKMNSFIPAPKSFVQNNIDWIGQQGALGKLQAQLMGNVVNNYNQAGIGK